LIFLTTRSRAFHYCLSICHVSWVGSQALFAWVCSWPRATIQGALSKIPGNLGLFAPAVNSEILYAGIFTLAVCAPLGAVALDLLGGALLRKIKAMEDQIQVL
jgi:hypothetical protein